MKKALSLNNRLNPVCIWMGLFLLLTFLVNPITVLADSNTSATIPYNVSAMASYNEIMLSNLDLVKQKVYQNYNIDDSHSLLIWTNDGFFRNSFYEYYIMIDPSVATGYTYSEDYDYLSNKIHLVSTYQVCRIVVRTDNAPPEISMSNGIYAHLLGSSSSVSTSIGYYLPLYPFYYDGDPIVSQEGYTLLVANIDSGNVAVQGHAVQPDPSTSFLGNNADFGASISSSTMPSIPTISHYSSSTYTPPAIDNSSVSSLLESLIEIVKYSTTYIINGIQGFISSIIFTIESYGQYVGSIIAYVGKAIITNIQYAIQNLYENIVSLFEPILNFISEVLNSIKNIVDEIISIGSDENGVFSLTTLFVNLAIPDSSDLQDLIEDSDTFGVISVFSSINTKVRQEYATLQGLTSQKIIHVPSCTYHGQEIGDFDIDFSWYDRYKSLGDGIISAFLIWNYIWFLFFRFPYWLRGNSSDFNGLISKGSD